MYRIKTASCIVFINWVANSGTTSKSFYHMFSDHKGITLRTRISDIFPKD
jgi:hypothetical protein